MFIGTFSCRRFYPLTPRPEDVDSEDLAHALSLVCRFTGHVSQFYSVAEHCLHVSRLVPEEHALAGLLHDAAEAYIADLASPIKHSPQFAFYRETEDRILAAIYERFGLEPGIPAAVIEADRTIVRLEAARLFREIPDWARPVPDDLPVAIIGHRPEVAERLYAARLRELTK